MSKTPFIWLGAGRAGKRGVGHRGVLLDKLARARLPVPQGAILLDDLFRIYLSEGIIELTDDRVFVRDPVWFFEVLYRDVRFPRLRAQLDICRLPENGQEEVWETRGVVSAVDSEDARQLALAIGQAWSIPGDAGERRRDVLVTKSVAAKTRGRAISRAGEVLDEVEVEGSDTAVLSLPRLRILRQPSGELQPPLGRLQMLLRGLRRSLGQGNWTVEWADDGAICWVQRVY